MTNTPTHSLRIAIDKEQILNIIYSESAWYGILHPEAKCITPDWERLTMMRVKDGFEELRTKFQAYIYFSNFNPNIEERNVEIEFRFFHPYSDTLPEVLTADVTQMLAWHALERFYGEHVSYFHTAKVKHLAGISMSFARDANYHLLHP